MNELRLTVNGELRKADPGTTVAGLLRGMGIDPARVAVEKNRDVVPVPAGEWMLRKRVGKSSGK